MVDQFMQCCYTRIGGQGVSAGWQTVACSDAIPAEIQKTYIMLQNQNIPDGTGNTAGQPEEVVEIVGRNAYLFLSRIRYGLTDELGRGNNMFAHSFVFPWNDENIENPNQYLTISSDHFKLDRESAQIIPETLIHTKPYTLEEAMELCGLDQKRYLTLIRCVFAQQQGKNIKPLYIHCEENQLYALLFCIYKGIPYYMRRTLSCATASGNISQKRNLIFSKQHSSNDYFIDPATAENNIVSPKLIHNFEQLGFVDRFAMEYDKPVAKNYYRYLEQFTILYGDPNASNHTLLKIVNRILLNYDIKQCSEEELISLLKEVLSVKVSQYQRLDNYLTNLMKVMNERDYELPEEVEESFWKRSGITEDPQLLLEGETYSIKHLGRMTVEEGAAKLGKLPENVFLVYAHRLVEMSNGFQIVDLYYSKYRIGDGITWDELYEVASEMAQVIHGSSCSYQADSYDKIKAAANALYNKALNQGEDMIAAYDSYAQVIRAVSTEEELELELKMAKENYWSKFTIQNYTQEAKEEYEFFEDSPHSNCELEKELRSSLASVAEDALETGLNAVTVLARRFFIQRNSEAKECILNQMNQLLEHRAITDQSYRESMVEIKKWYFLVINIGDERIIEEIADLGRHLIQWDMTQIELYLEDLSGSIQDKCNNYSEIFRVIMELYGSKCLWAETKGIEISLDLWLLLGDYAFDNPFMILNNKELMIMTMEADAVIEQSDYLNNSRYLQLAKNYVEAGEEWSKLVNNWIKAVSKQNKIKLKQEKKNDGKTNGFLKQLFHRTNAKKEKQEEGPEDEEDEDEESDSE